MTIGRTTLLLLSAAISLAATALPASAFLAANAPSHRHCAATATTAPRMAAESEVSFSEDLDGSSVRIGVLRTRWNDEHVSNLVEGIKVSDRVKSKDAARERGREGGREGGGWMYVYRVVVFPSICFEIFRHV
jgi:hypothetical protein